MNFENRIKRLKTILELLSKGYELSTPSLVERFGVTKKIIQTDFKEYLLPLAPLLNKNAPIDAACPIQIVQTSGLI